MPAPLGPLPAPDLLPTAEHNTQDVLTAREAVLRAAQRQLPAPDQGAQGTVDVDRREITRQLEQVNRQLQALRDAQAPPPAGLALLQRLRSGLQPGAAAWLLLAGVPQQRYDVPDERGLVDQTRSRLQR